MVAPRSHAYALLEAVDPAGSEEVAEGELGKLVATSLDNPVTPMVRFRSDDILGGDRGEYANHEAARVGERQTAEPADRSGSKSLDNEQCEDSGVEIQGRLQEGCPPGRRSWNR